jgi:hypothetical protein
MRRGGALALALLMLTTGCIGVSTDEGSTSTAEARSADELEPLTENRTTSLDRNATVDDWFTMQTETGPQAPLASFTWTVPEGTILEYEFFGETYETVVLELVPELDDDASLQDAAIVVFGEGENGQEIKSGLLATSFEQRTRTAVFESENATEAELEPAFLPLGVDDVDPGDELTFVLTARTEEPGTLGVGFRPLTVMPSGLTDPAEDVAELDAQERTPAIAMEARANGMGFQPAVYLDTNVGALLGAEIWTPPRRGGPLAARRRPTRCQRPRDPHRDHVRHRGWLGHRARRPRRQLGRNHVDDRRRRPRLHDHPGPPDRARRQRDRSPDRVPRLLRAR